MKQNRKSKSGFSTLRVFLAFTLCFLGGVCALLSWAAPALPSESANAGKQPAPAKAATTHSFVQNIFAAIWRPAAAPAGADTLRPTRPGVMRASATSSRKSAAAASSTLTPAIGVAVSATVSPAVRDLPAINPFTISVGQETEGKLTSRSPDVPTNPLEHDPVVQSATAPTVGMPPVGASFEGVENNQACNGCIPPDPNGAVGPNHFVQMVNSSFAIYSKSGAVLSPPKAINSLWSLIPNSTCATHNNGDPIVIYDQLADRWLLSQFTVQSGSEDYAECIAISTSPDPTGTYYLYQFDESADTFHDYPHIGVWPDGYYMTTNLFPNSALLFSTGAGAWAFERPQMLLGQPARYVFFDETGLSTGCAPNATCTYVPGGQLPTSVEGKNPPPAGAPDYFVEIDDTNTPETPPAVGLHDEMHIWKFHVDWTNPANSTFGTGSTSPALKPGFTGQYAGNAGQPNFILPIANFIHSQCSIANGPNDCVPQKVLQAQPPEFLDVLGDRLMYRVTYRNFGDHESLLINHTVDTADPSSGAGVKGVRWYELRSLSSTPTVYQQSTFAPLPDPNDPTSVTNGPLSRWMGSIAQDHSGDIAVAYSASGANYFPSLHYAGRLPSDPLNELTQGEAVLFAGLGIEVAVPDYLQRNRWGDYSNLTIDPTDDCTFWYTNEYLPVNGPTDGISIVEWHTRIGSFKFPQCTPAGPPPLTSVVSRKTHGSLTPLADLPLNLTGTPTIECRAGGIPTGDHKLIFSFTNSLTGVSQCTATATTSSGTQNVSCNGSTLGVSGYEADLTGVPNASHVTVTLHLVTDVLGNAGDVSVNFDVLYGDVNSTGRTDAGDVTQVRNRTVSIPDTTNPASFRYDVNISGRIDAGDVTATRNATVTVLPP
jgi:hypothetical protein